MAEGFLENSISDYSDDVLLCHPCSKRNKHSVGIIYCGDCDEIQCQNCSKEHDTFVVMGHHATVSIDDWRNSSIFLDMTKISQCETHNLTFMFYCETDNKLCCSECRKNAHRDCSDVMRLSEIDYKLTGKESENIRIKYEQLLEKANELLSKSEQHELGVKNQNVEMKNVIQDMRKQLLAKIDKFEEKILEEGKGIENARLETLKKIKTRTSTVVTEVQNSLKNVKYQPKSMTPEQKFVFKKKMEEVFESYNDKVKLQTELLRIVGENPYIQFSDKMLDFLDDPPVDLGKINFTNETVDSDFVPDPQAIEMRQITSKSMRPGDGRQPFFIGMDFLQDDRIVLADNIYKKCVLMSTSLKVIGEQSLKYAPQNLRVFGNDELLISAGTNQFIDYFEVNLQNILTFKRRIMTLSPCDSMSLMIDNTFVVGIADTTKPVCKLKDLNKCLNFDLDFGRENYRLGETKCAYSHNLEILVMTNYVTNTIFIIDTRNGNKTRVRDNVIKGPRSVVISNDGSIFVCCEGSCCLLQLSPSGEILSLRKLRMSFPYALCISKDSSKIAITNNSADDCLLQIFTIV